MISPSLCISCILSKGQSKVRIHISALVADTGSWDATKLPSVRAVSLSKPGWEFLRAAEAFGGSLYFTDIAFRFGSVETIKTYIKEKMERWQSSRHASWSTCFGTWEGSQLFWSSWRAYKYKISSMITESVFSMWIQDWNISQWNASNLCKHLWSRTLFKFCFQRYTQAFPEYAQSCKQNWQTL